MVPSFGLLPQYCVVHADETSDGGTGEDTGVPSVQGTVKTGNGRLGKKTAKGYALSVNNIGKKSLGNAECQGVNVVLRRMGLGARLRPVMAAVSAQVDKVSGEGGDEVAGEDPGQDRRPEACGDEEEYVREVNRVVRSANQVDSRNGEGEAIGENLGTDEEQFKDGNGQDDALDGGKGLTSGLRSLSDAALSVDGVDTLAQSDGGVVNSASNVGRGSWERDASSDLGKAAARSGNEGGGSTARIVIRRCDLLSKLGDSALGRFYDLLDLIFDRLLLHGRAKGLGAGVVVA